MDFSPTLSITTATLVQYHFAEVMCHRFVENWKRYTCKNMCPSNSTMQSSQNRNRLTFLSLSLFLLGKIGSEQFASQLTHKRQHWANVIPVYFIFFFNYEVQSAVQFFGRRHSFETSFYCCIWTLNVMWRVSSSIHLIWDAHAAMNRCFSVCAMRNNTKMRAPIHT